MTEQPFVSVIIPTYNDWQRLVVCLAALSAQTYPSDRFEVLVINNNPEDSPPSSLALSNLRIINEALPGSYAARNTGIALAKGDILAFTDSDCVPDIRWIENAVSNLLLGGAKRLAGKVELIFRSKRRNLAEIYEEKFSFLQDRHANDGFAATANMVTWKTCFCEVGIFNAGLMSGGDYEWGARAQKCGIAIRYAPDVIVRHPARDSIRSLLQRRRRILGGRHQISTVRKVSMVRLLFLGFLPPLRIYSRSEFRAGLSVSVWSAMVLMLWALKAYSSFHQVLLRLEITRPTRF